MDPSDREIFVSCSLAVGSVRPKSEGDQYGSWHYVLEELVQDLLPLPNLRDREIVNAGPFTFLIVLAQYQLPVVAHLDESNTMDVWTEEQQVRD